MADNTHITRTQETEMVRCIHASTFGDRSTVLVARNSDHSVLSVSDGHASRIPLTPGEMRKIAAVLIREADEVDARETQKETAR